ncbi:Phosphoenolpyruvate synthase [Nymphon striatum]|nr:Phosphoenolpyruvate synthase [Nymphon striatum]
MNTYNVIWLDQLGINDIDSVGGKNASLGEMIQNLGNLGVNVPGGFATTADAYRGFLEHENLGNRINALLDELDVDNLEDLAKTGKQIRDWIMQIPLQEDLENDINEAYKKLVAQYGEEVTWAVRSSATAEDLPDASFAGQQETFLNVSGIEDIKIAIRKVFASLFTDRAISYRVHQNFDHAGVALSAGNSENGSL